VARQTYPQRELVIIDGGSTDGTVEILKFNDAKITYWESKPDRSVYHAWNKAIDHARGEWLCFLGNDDYLWSHDVLERIAPHLVRAAPETRVVYGQVAIVNEVGNVLEVVGQSWERVRRRFLQEMVIPHQGVFHHRDLFLHGRFDESFCIAGDYELLLRELRRREARFMKGVVVAGMQIGGMSNTPARTLTVLREFARARRQLGVTGFPFHWWLAFAKAWIRRILTSLFGDRCSKIVADFYRRATGRSPIWTQ